MRHRSVRLQTGEQLYQAEKAPEIEVVSRQHSLYQSKTNSDFLQSGAPDLKDEKVQQAKPQQTVDMGTDPMSAHGVSERQNFGSEYTLNSQKQKKQQH